MKKKLLLTLGALTLIALSLLANAFVGNPVSKALATRTAKRHMAAHYPSYTLERVGYNFKDGNYYAHLTDPEQVDGDFSLSLDWWGNLQQDTYADRVLSGWNTRDRLHMEYRALCADVLENPDDPLPLDFGFGDLNILSRENLLYLGADLSNDRLFCEDLVPNAAYDVRALGAQAGYLIYYLEDESPSAEVLAHWLLEIRRRMDDANIPFVSIDLSIRYLRDDQGNRPNSDIHVREFPYEEIYEEGLLSRVQAAIEQTNAYYDQQDK